MGDENPVAGGWQCVDAGGDLEAAASGGADEAGLGRGEGWRQGGVGDNDREIRAGFVAELLQEGGQGGSGVEGRDDDS